uniref:Uncharacterized protein n=1 Tax=Plectus sambesii TaxID=2011161 RepID=A0A914WLR6_9BILA
MMEATERAAGELPSMAANPYMYSWLKATTRTASGRRAKPFHDDSDASHTYRSTAAGQKPYMALSSVCAPTRSRACYVSRLCATRPLVEQWTRLLRRAEDVGFLVDWWVFGGRRGWWIENRSRVDISGRFPIDRDRRTTRTTHHQPASFSWLLPCRGLPALPSPSGNSTTTRPG